MDEIEWVRRLKIVHADVQEEVVKLVLSFPLLLSAQLHLAVLQ